MQGKVDNNTVLDDFDTEQTDYEFNFFNTPWDDRSQKSKIGVVSLLFVIFVATIAIVINNIVIFYNGFRNTSLDTRDEIKCNLVRIDKYRYAARIRLITSQEIICVGARVSASSVLAHAVCLKSGPVRLYLGSLTSHHCRKGFPVDVTEHIPREWAARRSFVLLTTHENILECGDVIRMDVKASVDRPALIVGRPPHGGRTLSFQAATIVSSDNLTSNTQLMKGNLNKDNVICVEHFSKCPVQAGDLIVQSGRLIGIASTGTHGRDYNKMSCFANLSQILDELRELDVEVQFD